MKRVLAFVAVIILGLVGSVSAEYMIDDKGTWPQSWPGELEPLRKQSRTFEGGLVNAASHYVPFTKREEFESAWPHLLKVKSEGAPVILLRSGATTLSKFKAGVVVHTPPTDKKTSPEAPLAGIATARGRWPWTTYIELVVDGNIVDLNRIPLPADTPILDQRFKETPTNQSQNK
jgi:hypothetical protein